MEWLLIICGLLMALYAAFILVSSYYFGRAQGPPQPSADFFPFVSIVIPARNEAAHIEACLRAALKQSYTGTYEVILVDDHSTDDTWSLAQTFLSLYPQLKLVAASSHGKKAAISQGISQARGEIIFQTDADCQVGPNWLSSMLPYFLTNPRKYVSGPVALRYKGLLFQPLQALESMGLVVFGAGFLMAGKPNMSNGANMAYGKEVFTELGGFAGVDHVASGDDELLLQKINLSGNFPLSFCKDPRAIVYTDAMQNWKEFKMQRVRWLSKARAYLDWKPTVIQIITYLSFLTFPVLLLASWWDSKYMIFCLAFFFVKMLVDLILMSQAARFFHNLRILFWFVPLEILYVPYVIWIGLAGLSVKTYTWKGRTVS